MKSGKRALAVSVLAILATACFAQAASPSLRQSSGDKAEAKERLSQVKVGCLYENITDGVAMGRSIDETIRLLKETHTDFVFRGFWKWTPVVESPDEIPPGLLKLVEDRNITAAQASVAVLNRNQWPDSPE